MIALLIASHFVLAALGLWVGRRIVRSGLSRELPRLRDTASELSGSAEQVGIISRDLAAASQEQIDSLCTTMSASHEIRSMVETTSKNSAVLRQDARDLRELAGNGARTLEKMVQSSQEIKDGAEQFSVEMQESVAQLMQALGVIQEIAHKTKLINEIVFQTKLLSFNASVEAARAGESGKGFAVVAEEVGRLAQLSGTASLEINQIVDRSVVVVQQAIETTKNKISTLADQTIQRGDAGYRDAKSCELIFNEMTGKITQVAQMIEQISVAAQEQAAGVTQLDQSIGSLQEVADRNRLVASQTTEYGREFETQTGILTKALTALGSLSKMVAPKRVLQKFVWNKQLDLGVKAMDDEHKILVDRINSLVVALEARTSKVADAKLLNAFRALKNYTIEHFTHEEQFLDEIGYAQASSHKKIHEKLLGQVAAYEKQLEDGTLNDEKLVLFLRNWLISHIMGVDMQYAEFHKSSSHGAPARASRTA